MAEEAVITVEVMAVEVVITVEVMAEGDQVAGEADVTDHVTVEQEADEADAIEEVPDADMVAK